MTDTTGEAPFISIVTSTLDAARELPYTVKSLAAQRGASFEWIVVDGGSRDATLNLLRAAGPLLASLASEPDAGIYDAWNKACGRARGEWLLFLGAGDELAAPDTLATFSGHLVEAHPAHDLVYGRLVYLSPAGREPLEEVGAPWSELRGRWEIGRPAIPPHPAVFHHRSLFANGQRFDPRFRIAGDAHFLLRYGLRKAPLFVPAAVVRVAIRGISMDLRTAPAVAREIRDMNQELSLVPPLGHRVAEAILLAAKVVAARLPEALGHRLADLYRRALGRPKRWSVR